MKAFVLFLIARTISTLGVCTLGGYAMSLTNGRTGIGWALLGVLIIWGSGVRSDIGRTRKRKLPELC